MTEKQQENYGFIYTNNILKESLIANQIPFKNTNNTEFNENSTSSVNKYQNVGKICIINLKSKRQKSNKDMES
jgi:hypothetical protein